MTLIEHMRESDKKFAALSEKEKKKWRMEFWEKWDKENPTVFLKDPVNK